MSSLPWDRFPAPAPDESLHFPAQPPEEELPYKPPDSSHPYPSPPVYKPDEDLIDRVAPGDEPWSDNVDLSTEIGKAVRETLSKEWPTLRQEASDYLKATIELERSGQKVDHAHPDITAVTSKGKELKVADAKSRSARTFFQGLAIDIFYALVALLLSVLHEGGVLNKVGWAILIALVIKTLIQTVISYIMRMKITPTAKDPEGQRVHLLPLPVPMASKPEQAA